MERTEVTAGILSRVAQVIGVFAFQAVILFVGAGGVDWVWAWVFLGICVMSFAVNSMFLFRINPEAIAVRGRPGKTTGWDKIVGGLWSLVLFLAVPLLAALDRRYSWTGEISETLNILGGLLLAIGLGLAGWAMVSNAFFSTAVRIQTERGHTVCQSGPYRLVRHPGYAGFILQSLGTPVLLGSVWALPAGVVGALLLVIRTAFEDRFLHTELPGYQEYALKVPHRLIPGFW